MAVGSSIRDADDVEAAKVDIGNESLETVTVEDVLELEDSVDQEIASLDVDEEVDGRDDVDDERGRKSEIVGVARKAIETVVALEPFAKELV